MGRAVSNLFEHGAKNLTYRADFLACVKEVFVIEMPTPSLKDGLNCELSEAVPYDVMKRVFILVNWFTGSLRDSCLTCSR